MTPCFDAEVRPHARGWLGTVEVEDALLGALKRTVARHVAMPLGTFELRKRVVTSVRPSRTPSRRPPEAPLVRGTEPRQPSRGNLASLFENVLSLMR